MADPSIALAFRNPQIEDPMVLQGRAMSLQQMAQSRQMNDQQMAQSRQMNDQQMQINQARLQEEKLKADAQDRYAQDDAFTKQTYAEAIKNHPADKPFDLDSAVRTKIVSRVGQQYLQDFDKSTKDHADYLGKKTKDELELDAKRIEGLSRHLDAVMAVKPGDTSAEAEALRDAEWKKQVTIAKAKGYDPDNTTDLNYPGYAQLPVYSTMLKGGVLHTKTAAEMLKAQTEAAKAKADEALAPVKQGEAENKAVAEAMKTYSPILSQQDTVVRYNTIREGMKPEVAKLFPAPPPTLLPTDKLPEEFRSSLRNLGKTSAEIDTASLTQQARDNTAQRNQLRQQIADQNDRLRRDLGGQKGNGLTQAQITTEARNIAALENGTAAQPGLNAQRLRIGADLKRGKTTDSKGKTVELDADGREALQSRLAAINDSLQQTLFRKAKLYNVTPPDPTDVKAAAEGADIEATDGSIWKKSSGVAFFVKAGASNRQAEPEPAKGTQKPEAPKAASQKPAQPLPKGAVSVKAPDGSVHTFPNQAAADKFKKLANIP